MAKMTFSESIVINCGIEDAFALLENVDRHTEIFANNGATHGYHGGQMKVGDGWISVGQFMGREIKTNYKVVEHAPPEKLVFETTSSSASGSSTWVFETVEGGTKVTISTEGEPKGFFANVASQLLRSNFEKLLSKNMESLKAILEG